MFILADFIISAARLIHILFNVFFWLIFLRAVISWVNADPYNPIVRFLQESTEPVLAPVRRLLARFQGTIGMDFSPFVVVLIIWFLDSFVTATLMDLAFRLK